MNVRTCERGNVPTCQRVNVFTCRHGITFVSVVILVAVISLSVWSALVLSDIILKSRSVEKTEQEMEMIKQGLYNFYRDCDQFVTDTNVITTDFADLESLPAATRFEGSASLQSYRQSKWDGPYVQDKYDDNGFMKDAWQTDYVYNYTPGATTCTLTSYGLNRVAGGGDDITITIYADDIIAEKIRKTKEELAYINAKKDELETRYKNAGHSWPPTGFGIDDLFKTYGADTTGLVSWWKMDEDSWNGTAGEVVDSQGTNNGTASTPSGPTTVSTSKIGRCGSFDGTDDYVESVSTVDLDLTQHAVTLETWVYPIYRAGDPSWATWQIVGKWASLASALKGNGTTDVRIGAYLNGNANWFSIGNKWEQWIHLVAVYEADSNERKLYVNGEFINTDTSGSLGDYTGKIAIGKNNYNTIPYGKIDEVRIWNRALPSTDVFQEYLRGVYLTDWAYKYDEWETEYVWDSINDEFYSYGPDRAFGGGDDIYQ